MIEWVCPVCQGRVTYVVKKHYTKRVSSTVGIVVGSQKIAMPCEHEVIVRDDGSRIRLEAVNA